MSDQNQKKAKDVRKKRRRRRPWPLTVILRLFQTIGTLILVAVLTGSLVCCYGAIYIKTVIMPNSKLDTSAYTMDENSTIYYYDDAGDPVELDTLSGDENRESVTYEDIPQDLIDAFVAIEDKRFWQHDGVDWYRTAGALVNMFLSMKNTFGGSTITQQLIKNVTEYDDGNVKRKVVEIFTALDLENRYKKEDIITWYMNEIFLGNGCYGVQAAAEKYFGKHVSELSLAECASLAGITNNPSLYGPYSSIETLRHRCANPNCLVWSSASAEICDMCGGTEFGEDELWDARRWNKERQKTILKAMASEDNPNGAYITQEEYETALAEELVFARDRVDEEPESEEPEETEVRAVSSVHSWYVDAVVSEVIADLMAKYGWSESYAKKMVYSGGLSIYIPYDPDIQAKVDEIYTNRTHLDESLKTVSKIGQQLSSAITVVDNSTGYVVAIAGDVGEKTINRAWNNALANRQPGSSIKPLAVYSPAVEMGLVTPATIVDDNPRLLGENPWPVNSFGEWRGLTTVMKGVVNSVNTISVSILEMVTPQLSYEFVTERYGLTSLTDGTEINGQIKSDVTIASLSMGGLTNGVSTFEMAAAFATFPRNGAFTEATTYLLVKNSNGEVLLNNKPKTEFVIKESTAYYINQMLTEAVQSGTGKRAKIDGLTVAGKTGTTSNKFDLWFCGYTPYYTAAVWTGFPVNEYIDATNPSVKLWKLVMEEIHEDLDGSIGFYEPDDLVSVRICMDCGKLATSDCANDIRGSRSQTFTLIKSDRPTGYCVCHVPVVVCTESPILNDKGKKTGSYHLANEYCPEECRKEVIMVDYDRVLATEEVFVEDSYAHVSIYSTMENPYCTIHTPPEPVVPDPTLPVDPTDPNIPPVEDPNVPPTGEPDVPPTEEPTTPPAETPGVSEPPAENVPGTEPSPGTEPETGPVG